MVEFKSRQESDGANIEASHRRLHETRRNIKKNESREKEKARTEKERATPSHPKNIGPPVRGVSCQDAGGCTTVGPSAVMTIAQCANP